MLALNIASPICGGPDRVVATHGADSFRRLSFLRFVGRAGSAWLVTFPEGRDHDAFDVRTESLGGTSPFALVEEVRVHAGGQAAR